jgi:hypothetical protein
VSGTYATRTRRSNQHNMSVNSRTAHGLRLLSMALRTELLRERLGIDVAPLGIDVASTPLDLTTINVITLDWNMESVIKGIQCHVDLGGVFSVPDYPLRAPDESFWDLSQKVDRLEAQLTLLEASVTVYMTNGGVLPLLDPLTVHILCPIP